MVTTLIYTVMLFGNVISGPTSLTMDSREACEMARQSVLASANTKHIQDNGGTVTVTCETK